MKRSDLMIKIQTLADVQSLANDECLPHFYIEEINEQFRWFYEAENEGEEIEEFSLSAQACIYHFNDEKDRQMLEKQVDAIEYVDMEEIDEAKYFRIGIMQDHQMSVIYFLAGTLPIDVEKCLENRGN